MNEWESSQTSNRLELMMKKNIGHAQSFSLSVSVVAVVSRSLFLSLALFPFQEFLSRFSRSYVMKRVYHATIVSGC